MKKHERKKAKAIVKRFEHCRTDALAYACEGVRSLILTGHDDHCIQHLARMLSALETELAGLPTGGATPLAARALLMPAARSRHDAINEPRLRLAAMLGAIGNELAMMPRPTPQTAKRSREKLADIIVAHAKAVLLMADLNAERDRAGAAA